MKKLMLAIAIFFGTVLSVQTLSLAETVDLPEINLDQGLTVAEAIYQRRSVRSYSPDALTLSEVGQVLWAAMGQTVDGITGPTRAYPSAGGIYPLSVYLVAGNVDGLDPGIYRYNWAEHSLLMVAPGDKRAQLRDASRGQGMLEEAPCSIIVTADMDKITRRYGDRGRHMYAPIDTGHLAQNVNLQAESLGLGCVMVGAFTEKDVSAMLEGVTEKPVYIIPFGRKSD